MNYKERVLAAKLLKLSADEFGNHGCNDVDDDMYEGWTLAERQQFVKEFHDWNGDQEEYDPRHINLPDFCLMDYLASKLLLP